MADEVRAEGYPRKWPAKKIIMAMKRANIANALKVALPEWYEKVPYSQFIAVYKTCDLTKEQERRIEILFDEVHQITFKANPREDKVYVMFILKLQEILHDPSRT